MMRELDIYNYEFKTISLTLVGAGVGGLIISGSVGLEVGCDG